MTVVQSELFNAVRNNDTVATRRLLLSTEADVNMMETCEYYCIESSFVEYRLQFWGENNGSASA